MDRTTIPDTPMALQALSTNFDTLETAGHCLLHLSGPIAGCSTYWCEGCGAIAVFYQGEFKVFEAPSGSASTERSCDKPAPPAVRACSPLKTKLVGLSWEQTRHLRGEEHEP